MSPPTDASTLSLGLFPADLDAFERALEALRSGGAVQLVVQADDASAPLPPVLTAPATAAPVEPLLDPSVVKRLQDALYPCEVETATFVREVELYVAARLRTAERATWERRYPHDSVLLHLPYARRDADDRALLRMAAADCAQAFLALRHGGANGEALLRLVDTVVSDVASTVRVGLSQGTAPSP